MWVLNSHKPNRWCWEKNMWHLLWFFTEEAEKPADLSQKIVFKGKRIETADDSSGSKDKTKKEKEKSKKQKQTKSLLSFGDDEENDN